MALIAPPTPWVGESEVISSGWADSSATSSRKSWSYSASLSSGASSTVVEPVRPFDDRDELRVAGGGGVGRQLGGGGDEGLVDRQAIGCLGHGATLAT